LKNKKPAIKETYRESGGGNENARDQSKLVKFFEVLMEIDRRQKRNGKNN
jgi:hypothetical protein